MNATRIWPCRTMTRFLRPQALGLASRRQRCIGALTALAVAAVLVPAAAAGSRQLRMPHRVEFGNARVGSIGERGVTLTNTSKEPMHIYGIGVSSDTGSFTIDGANNHCAGAVLPPRRSCTYGILYTPIVPGEQVGRSDIEFGPSGIAFVTLAGHANAAHTTSSAAVDHGANGHGANPHGANDHGANDHGANGHPTPPHPSQRPATPHTHP